MGDIDDETAAHLGQTLLRCTEDSKVRQGTVLGLVLTEELGDVVTTPREVGPLLLSKGGA